MDAHTAMDEWETAPFDGGLDELARMGRRGFSGAVESGTDWLFLADGEPVAVVSDLEEAPEPGDVDAFEGASGQAHEAPHPTAARLVPMLALEGEVRGEYFSDDTPIATVHETLAEGGFTGYLELAENVLSGDYYVVYEDGEADYVAYIGSTDRLATGEEAEAKTKNEVGIYSVVAVDLPTVELPDPPEPTGGTGAAAGADVTDGDPEPTPEPTDDPGPVDTAAEPTGDTAADPEPESTPDPGAEPEPERDPEPDRESGGAVEASDPVAGAGSEPEPVDDEAPDARTVPSLDPERTGGASSTAGGTDTEPAPSTDEQETAPESEDDEVDAGSAATEVEPDGRVEAASNEAALEDVRAELQRLREAYDRLEGRVAALESGGDSATSTGVRTDGPSMSPAEALSKTTLFVREGTRGGPTLEDAHEGRADREALAANVGLERHTRFDEAGATVDGEPFESFLESSQPYEFVEWLVTDLLFEIRLTGTEDEMAHLYDAIPAVDRVFFNESVTVDDGDGSRELTFDVVVRDRNGEPLFVAALEESREPTPASAVEPLVTDASDFCAANDSVSGAFAVTASYFEPGALELAREATSGSLLSRQRYRSFVNLTRKNGFHLCLVEAREASLHLTLPEL